MPQTTYPISGEFAPSGAITLWATGVAPTNWLLCDGTAVSRSTYDVLYGVIGTTYGVGNGSTTFNLPNLKGKVPVGYDATQDEFNDLGETGGAKTHAHADGTYAAASHSHGDGSYAAAGHTHAGGTYSAGAHTHAAGSYAGTAHAHGLPFGEKDTATVFWKDSFSGTMAGNGEYTVKHTQQTGTVSQYVSDSGGGGAVTGTSAEGGAGTVSGSSGSSGADVAGTSGAAGADVSGTSGAGSSLAPYITLNYIIRV